MIKEMKVIVKCPVTNEDVREPSIIFPLIFDIAIS